MESGGQERFICMQYLLQPLTIGLKQSWKPQRCCFLSKMLSQNCIVLCFHSRNRKQRGRFSICTDTDSTEPIYNQMYSKNQRRCAYRCNLNALQHFRYYVASTWQSVVLKSHICKQRMPFSTVSADSDDQWLFRHAFMIFCCRNNSQERVFLTMMICSTFTVFQHSIMCFFFPCKKYL